MKVNKNYLKLEESYLISTVNRKVREYQANHPEKDIIRLGIGDVTIPICPSAIEAMHRAVDDQPLAFLYVEACFYYEFSIVFL